MDVDDFAADIGINYCVFLRSVIQISLEKNKNRSIFVFDSMKIQQKIYK